MDSFKLNTITPRDARLLSYGHREEVNGDFSHYFFSAWYPLARSRKTTVEVIKRKKKSKLRKVAPPTRVISWKGVEAFMAIVDDAVSAPVNGFTPKTSKFLVRTARSNIFCAMNQCYNCINNLPPLEPEGSEIVLKPRVTLSAPDNCDSENAWMRDLTRECVESNPGPCTCPPIPPWDEHPSKRFFIATVETSAPNAMLVHRYRYITQWTDSDHFDSSEVGKSVHCIMCTTRTFRLAVIGPYAKAIAFMDAIMDKPGFPCIQMAQWISSIPLVGVELNPGPSELNGNTKRNSKSHKVIDRHIDARLERLAMRDDDIGSEMRQLLKKRITERRQNANHRYQMNQLFPETQSLFDVNHKVTVDFGVLKALEKVGNLMPTGNLTVVRWADVAAAIHIIFTNEAWTAKYLAVRALIKEFQVNGVNPDHLLMAIIGVLSYCSVKTFQAPQLQSLDPTPFATIVSLILTFLFGGKPKQSKVDLMLNHVKDLNRSALGIETILRVCNKILEYFSSEPSTEALLEKKIDRITTLVNYWMKPSGEQAVMLDPAGFEEVVSTVIEANELMPYIPAGKQKEAFGYILYHLRAIQRKVSQSPVSGHSYRKEPVVINLVGKPGIGKTFLIQTISADALKIIFELSDLPSHDIKSKLEEFHKYVYWRPVGHRYETNYNSAYSKVYVMDDANQVDVNHLGDDLPAAARLIHLKNNADHLLPVAELENKKTAKFNSDLIIMTDNTDEPDLSYLQSADAYRRRINLQYTVTLKDEYTKVANGVRVADPTTFDGEIIDTNGWLFEDRYTNVKYSYEQIMEQLKRELQKAHDEFTGNRKKLLEYAIRGFKQPQQQTEVVDTYRCSMPQTQMKSNPDSENIVSLFEEVESVRDPSKPISLKKEIASIFCTYIFGIISFAVVTAYTGALIGYIDKHKRKEMTRWKFFKSMLVIRWYNFAWPLNARIACVRMWYRNKKKSLTEKDQMVMKRVLYLSTLGLLAVSGYLLYRKSKKTVSQENYSSGDATKTKKTTKPTSKPKGKLSAVRQHPQLQSDVVVEKYDGMEFTNSPVLESSADSSMAQLCKKYAAQSYEVSLVGPGRSSQIKGFFVFGRVFVCNAHILLGFDDLTDCYISLKGIRNSYRDISMNDVYVIKLDQEGIQAYDVVFFEFEVKTGVAAHSDLRNSFLKQSDGLTMVNKNVVLCTVSQEDIKSEKVWIVQKQFSSIVNIDQDWFGSQDCEGNMSYSYGVFEYRAQSCVGYCGSAVFINDSKVPNKIIGIHTAGWGGTDICYGAFVTREMIDAVFDAASKENKFSQTQCSRFQLMEKKHTVIDNDFLHVTCLPHSVSSPVKTKISKSIIHGKVSQPRKFPAPLGYFSNENETFHVVNKALKKYTGPSISVGPFHRNIFFAFLKKNFGKTRPIEEFDLQTAIRGIEGNEYVRAINRASSPGYPFILERERGLQGKKTFLGEDDEFKYDHPLLLSEIEKYIEAAKKNERPIAYFTSTAKDELRSKERVDAGKTRSFAAAPLHYVTLFRQKYLDIFADITQNRISNGSLVGVNPHSSEWDFLVRTLTQVARPEEHAFIAGDYSNFDGTLNQSLLWVIYEFLESEYNRTNDPVSFALWHDITQSQQIFGNCVIEVTRGQPSGNPGTSMINSLYNAALVYLVLHCVLSDYNTKEALEIRDNLANHYRAVVYGDDNLLSFSHELRSIVEPIKISEKMLSFGHIYTSDDKNNATLRYLPLAECSILKRRFVKDERTRRWMCPLTLDSILEPLNWDKVDPRQESEKRVQTAVNVRTALRELVYYDCYLYEHYQKLMLSACRENNIPLDIQCYHTWSVQKQLTLELQNFQTNMGCAVIPENAPGEYLLEQPERAAPANRVHGYDNGNRFTYAIATNEES